MLAAGGVWCVESRGWMEEGGAKCKSGGLEVEGGGGGRKTES